jgi:tRNA nucleotidyltransferase (CCA-adding enzyme)
MKFRIKPLFSPVLELVQSKLGRENTYLVGGFVRDTLLGRKTRDMDFATPLRPEVVSVAFPDATCFRKYGNVSFTINGIHVTITSFRRETGYKDFRHPSSVTFISSLEEDAKRRDFTINCLYVNAEMNILDPTRRGIKNLTKHELCLIGRNKVRLREDPLRILRAYRFQTELHFAFSEPLNDALIAEKPLLRKLAPAKVVEELNKVPKRYRKKLVRTLGLEWAFAL